LICKDGVRPRGEPRGEKGTLLLEARGFVRPFRPEKEEDGKEERERKKGRAPGGTERERFTNFLGEEKLDYEI
ncbi:hypothetical protein X777_08574, partial [Ooceraea biroi]